MKRRAASEVDGLELRHAGQRCGEAEQPLAVGEVEDPEAGEVPHRPREPLDVDAASKVQPREVGEEPHKLGDLDEVFAVCDVKLC